MQLTKMQHSHDGVMRNSLCSSGNGLSLRSNRNVHRSTEGISIDGYWEDTGIFLASGKKISVESSGEESDKDDAG